MFCWVYTVCDRRVLYWLVGWLIVGWLVGWLIGWLVGWLVGWLIGWLIGWLVGWLVGWLLIVWLSDWLHAARRWWKSIESVDCKHRQQCWSVCDGWNHREPVAAGARCHWSPFVHLLQLLKPLLLSSITVSIFHRCKKVFFPKTISAVDFWIWVFFT